VEVLKKIVKLLKPHPVRLPTPLPIPSDASQSKKTRGGQRLRKNRERYAMTDMRNLANKIHFGVPEESSLDGGLGAADYGMLLFLIPRVWIFFYTDHSYDGIFLYPISRIIYQYLHLSVCRKTETQWMVVLQ
jgi:U4/U6 small nuclear ribonucleoprotein PRP31